MQNQSDMQQMLNNFSSSANSSDNNVFQLILNTFNLGQTLNIQLHPELPLTEQEVRQGGIDAILFLDKNKMLPYSIAEEMYVFWRRASADNNLKLIFWTRLAENLEKFNKFEDGQEVREKKLNQANCFKTISDIEKSDGTLKFEILNKELQLLETDYDDAISTVNQSNVYIQCFMSEAQTLEVTQERRSELLPKIAKEHKRRILLNNQAKLLQTLVTAKKAEIDNLPNSYKAESFIPLNEFEKGIYKKLAIVLCELKNKFKPLGLDNNTSHLPKYFNLYCRLPKAYHEAFKNRGEAVLSITNDYIALELDELSQQLK